MPALQTCTCLKLVTTCKYMYIEFMNSFTLFIVFIYVSILMLLLYAILKILWFDIKKMLKRIVFPSLFIVFDHIIFDKLFYVDDLKKNQSASYTLMYTLYIYQSRISDFPQTFEDDILIMWFSRTFLFLWFLRLNAKFCFLLIIFRIHVTMSIYTDSHK